MASFVPREAYTPQELQDQYPQGLRLKQVQVLLRHGERTPVSPRFTNTGLHAYWPYCSAAQHLTSIIKQSGAEWTTLEWRRRLETFGPDDVAILASGPGGVVDGICHPGELTDLGRQTTYALGERLRRLYVEQLGFMPQTISDCSSIYLRSTPVPRALESLQQAFVGLYPPSARGSGFVPPTIISRSPADETLYPNDGVCRRFAELSRAFAQRSADRWNQSPEMDYISSKIGKWMPEGNDGRVKVDSRPRLSGVMDTINATDAHGSQTKLPKEFYDAKMRDIINRISVEEWFSGYKESREYRTLGIGSQVADIVERMVVNAEQSQRDRASTSTASRQATRFAMSGCHDTTLAATLASLGCFDNEKWPPFTSHITFELFHQPSPSTSDLPSTISPPTPLPTATPSLWSRFFGLAPSPPPQPTARTPLTSLPPAQHSASLANHYVRVRYNDRILVLPGCAPAGAHLAGQPALCTLAAFKAVVDDFTPRDWRAACARNLGRSAFPARLEPAGFPGGVGEVKG